VFNFSVRFYRLTKDAIYFTPEEPYSGLYRGNFKDKTIVKILDEQVGNFIIVNDFIYYGASDGFYKVKTDGTGKFKILPSSGPYTFTTDEKYLYYIENGGDLKRVKTDGTENIVIRKNHPDYPMSLFSLTADSGYLYYIERNRYGECMVVRQTSDGNDGWMLGGCIGTTLYVDGDTIVYMVNSGVKIDSVSEMLKSVKKK
jgi:hypothetical protein